MSPAAEIEVTIADIQLLPPTDMNIESIYDEMSESYILSISWKAPEGGVIDPAWYNVYCDGLEVGTMLEETSLEFYGYTKGIYMRTLTENRNASASVWQLKHASMYAICVPKQPEARSSSAGKLPSRRMPK